VKSQEFRKPLYDFSRGIVGNISDVGFRGDPNFLKRANNHVFSPMRALRVREGSRALCADVIAEQPHSLGKYQPTSGTKRLFAGVGADIYEVGALTYTLQSIPFALGGGKLWMSQLNDVLFASEIGGGQRPMCFIGASWVTALLPAPVAGAAAVGAAGNVNAGTHYYRVRNRYTNGSSTSYAIGSVAPGVASQINMTLLPAAAPGGRADWLGWTLERTKANDPLGANGRFFIVATGNTAAYTDNTADADLWDTVTEGWYTPPAEFDGVVPYRGRMFGWKGTFLYPSWEIGSDAYLGIMNFDPLNALRAGSDDGDSIQGVVTQGARAIAYKSLSMHFIEGSDLDSFNVVTIPDAGGIAGPRAVATMRGTIVVTYNSDGLFIMRGSTPEPFGWKEIGHYLDTVNPSRRADVVLKNIGNRYLIMCYSAGLSLYNNEALAYDFNTSTWAHYTEFNAEDMLYQQDGTFSNATILACDGQDRGAGPSEYQCYSMLDGIRDRRASDDSGGDSISTFMELTYLDLGMPDKWKDLNRVELCVEGTATDYAITIVSENGAAHSATVLAYGTGKDWCEDVATHPDDLEWDVGDWGADDQLTGVPVGIPGGVLGKLFSVTIRAQAAETTGLRGIVFDGRLRPERRKV